MTTHQLNYPFAPQAQVQLEEQNGGDEGYLVNFSLNNRSLFVTKDRFLFDGSFLDLDLFEGVSRSVTLFRNNQFYIVDEEEELFFGSNKISFDIQRKNLILQGELVLEYGFWTLKLTRYVRNGVEITVESRFQDGEWRSLCGSIKMNNITSEVNLLKDAIRFTTNEKEVEIKFDTIDPYGTVLVDYCEKGTRIIPADRVKIGDKQIVVFCDNYLPLMEQGGKFLGATIKIDTERYPIILCSPLFKDFLDENKEFCVWLNYISLIIEGEGMKFELSSQNRSEQDHPLENRKPRLQVYLDRFFRTEDHGYHISIDPFEYSPGDKTHTLVICSAFDSPPEQITFECALDSKGKLHEKSRRPYDPVIQKYYDQFSK